MAGRRLRTGADLDAVTMPPYAVGLLGVADALGAGAVDVYTMPPIPATLLSRGDIVRGGQREHQRKQTRADYDARPWRRLDRRWLCAGWRGYRSEEGCVIR